MPLHASRCLLIGRGAAACHLDAFPSYHRQLQVNCRSVAAAGSSRGQGTGPELLRRQTALFQVSSERCAASRRPRWTSLHVAAPARSPMTARCFSRAVFHTPSTAALPCSMFGNSWIRKRIQSSRGLVSSYEKARAVPLRLRPLRPGLCRVRIRGSAAKVRRRSGQQTLSTHVPGPPLLRRDRSAKYQNPIPFLSFLARSTASFQATLHRFIPAPAETRSCARFGVTRRQLRTLHALICTDMHSSRVSWSVTFVSGRVRETRQCRQVVTTGAVCLGQSAERSMPAHARPRLIRLTHRLGSTFTLCSW